jgi:hypothetical protein
MNWPAGHGEPAGGKTMRSKLIAALAALTMVASAQAVILSAGGGFEYEFLDFSGSGGSVLHPTGACTHAGADYRCDPMTFNGGIGGTLTATANGPKLVYQDLPQGERGLGVVSGPSGTSNTWISGDEVLKLSFSNAVNLVGYHIYQSGNAPGPDHFQVSGDGILWETRSFASVVFTQWYSDKWLTNTHTLWFKAEDNEKFYVGAVKITSAVPEPQTYALMFMGLGVVGFAARRRRSKD